MDGKVKTQPPGLGHGESLNYCDPISDIPTLIESETKSLTI